MKLKSIGRRITYSALGTALVFSVACSKNNDSTGTPGPDPQPQEKRLVRLEEDANNYTDFQYNADGTFKKIISASSDENGQSSNEMSFVYNAGKKITEIHNQDGTSIKYLYQGNTVSRADIYDETNQKIAWNEYTYEAGKIASITLIIKVNGENGSSEIPWMKTEFSYNANGDANKMTVYNANSETGVLEKIEVRNYEQYDNKTNPLSKLGDFSVIFLNLMSTRNALVEKAYDGDGNLKETIQNEFTYDDNGYPLTCKTTTTPAGGTAEVSTTKYKYN